MSLSFFLLECNGRRCSVSHCRQRHTVLAEKTSGQWESLKFILAQDDVTEFCENLLRVDQGDNGFLEHTGLRFNIDPDIGDILRQEPNGFPSPKSKLRALFDPLRLLHGVREVNITGSGHGDYLSHMNASICGPEPNAEETIDSMMAAVECSDEVFQGHDTEPAILRNKIGLYIDSSIDFYWEIPREIKQDGPFAGITAKENAKVKIHARMAAAYLNLGKLRMARI
ncbi:hypothetical protein OEA41_009717 [Lepraria neglecta]|uniref:Uncharacterized protein n=1 Tax=Lepraria neglecta TaxID=209136 RepID=A0AAD9Z2B8_9LECA|nr:hypothetical protein OEA41_009717 [Lepraria neglecta]